MDDFKYLDDSRIRDLADQCGRGFWKADPPLCADTHFVQKSRVKNYEVVAKLIQDRSDALTDPRTRASVWAAVCQAVDIDLEYGGVGGERDRAVMQLRSEAVQNVDEMLVKFVNHRMDGGERTWMDWIGVEVRDGR